MRSPSAQSGHRQITLCISGSPAAAWEQVVLPWFRAVSATAFRTSEPTLVVVPFRSHAYALKSLLLEQRVPLLGIRFLAPADLRDLLWARRSTELPLREHLRLLLSLAAEEEMALPDEPAAREQRMFEPEFLAARSVARAPDHLLRAFDQIGAAGWSFSEMGPSTLRGVVETFERMAGECGFSFVHIADRDAAARAQQAPPLFAHVLIAGFNAAHWPLWPLLHAAVISSRTATVVLDEPRDEAANLDQAWIGTWEENFGEAQRVGATTSRVGDFADVQGTFDFDGSAKKAAVTHFVVGSDATEQAHAVVAMAIEFLAASNCDRLGILFAGSGPLSRTVAKLFADAGICHNDGIAHFAPGPFEEPAWDAWLELQENPRLEVLLRFAKAHPRAREAFGALPLRRIEQTLRTAYRDILIDDLEVLREYCARGTEDNDRHAIASGIASLRFLPPQAAFAEFLSAAREMFEQLDWSERWAEVERLSKTWSGSVTARFSRRTYLRWLDEVTRSFFKVRERAGDHPYSRVHLLPYAEAEGQRWSHLILTGLNDGEWPPASHESGFLREEDIDSLNDRVSAFNRRSVRQGSQGEGHETLHEGKTLFLGPQQQRRITDRQFANLVERAECEIAFSASLFQESAPERLWNPSDYFSRLYFSSNNKPLSHRGMMPLQKQTRAWLGKAALFNREPGTGGTIEQTRIAFDARRQEATPASEYDFALRPPMPRPVTFRVTDWEKALRSPALVWMKIFLGVEATDEKTNVWSLATGQWAHHWLAGVSGESTSNRFVPLPEPDEFVRRISEAAVAFRDQVSALCARAGIRLPDWWTSGWRHAFYLAECLGARVAELRDWPRFATEWRLDPAAAITLEDGEQLRLRGRIDVILSRNDNATDCWLIDYKTGGRKTLMPTSSRSPEERAPKVRKKLRRGDAVQLGLYALAMHAAGADDIAMSLLSPLLEVEQPQLCLADIMAPADFWKELHRMQENGVFGMLGPVRSEFGFTAAYPLATLAIDLELLKQKWALTHPAFAEGDDEE